MAEKTLMKYTCPWCGHKFERLVGIATAAGPPGGSGGKTRHVSSQVTCYECGNFIKTNR